MTNQPNKTADPILTFEGARYNMNLLPSEVKEIVKGLQVADNQIHLHEDTIKVLALGRQSLAKQLKEALESVAPLEDKQA